MYKRKTHAKISFDVYRISDDTLAAPFEKEFDIDEITYKNEYEAITLDGSLTEWADNVAKLKALEVAALEIGSELPDSLDVTTLYGATFKAENINGHGTETTESGKIPQAIIDLYIRLKTRIKQELKKISIWELERDEIRKTKELSNEQIKEIRKLITKWERSQRTIKEDENRIKQLEEQYSDIEQTIGE